MKGQFNVYKLKESTNLSTVTVDKEICQRNKFLLIRKKISSWNNIGVMLDTLLPKPWAYQSSKYNS